MRRMNKIEKKEGVKTRKKGVEEDEDGEMEEERE